MEVAIDLCFKNKQCKYIAINKYGATWVNNSNKYIISLVKSL